MNLEMGTIKESRSLGWLGKPDVPGERWSFNKDGNEQRLLPALGVGDRMSASSLFCFFAAMRLPTCGPSLYLGPKIARVT